MEFRGDKVEVLYVEYFFMRIYGIGDDVEWIGRCYVRLKGLLLY